jgi:predicted metal-dependent hydrolase
MNFDTSYYCLIGDERRSFPQLAPLCGVHWPPMAQQQSAIQVDGEEVIVIRSAKRRRTVSADMSGGSLRLRVPMRLSRGDIETHARAFRKRLAHRAARAGHSDEALLSRALELAGEYLGDSAAPASVTWSERQLKRWGSTTSTTGEIRLSYRLRNMPGWVVDAVLVHELSHLIEPGHGPRFQELVNRYPRTREADTFLAGVTWADQQASR